MIETSPEFKSAVYAPVRSITARVTFDISDVTAADDASVSVTSEAEISRKDQLTDQERQRPKYATFEPDYWKLDGTFVLPPKRDEIGHQVGWYSDEFSGTNGEFPTPQVMDFTFTEPHDSIGLTITFDELVGEYAVDFDVEAYDANGSLIKRAQIRGNTEPRAVIEEPIAGYRRIRITLLRWSRPDRRAKVTEVSFGIVRTYDDDKLIKLTLLEEIDTTSEKVPANELKFVVDNSSREFNILNPDGFYAFLQERQTAVVEMGVQLDTGIEWVPMGMYFLIDWQSDEGALSTTFTARNRIDFIPEVEIEKLTGSSTNLGALAENVLSLAGIERYYLDPALYTISTQGIYKKTTYRKLLQMIAIAGQCVMHVDRDDRLYIERLPSGNPVDAITFDNIYREPKIRLDRLVSRVEVNYYSDADTITGTYVLTSTAKGGATLKVENTLINSQSHAQSVAQWIMTEASKRAIYEVNWRQNPALETADIVTIEDVYGANKSSRIIKQEYEYAGYLTGKTTSKGAI